MDDIDYGSNSENNEINMQELNQEHNKNEKSSSNSPFVNLSQVSDNSDGSSTTELVSPSEQIVVNSDSGESSATELVTPETQSLSPELSDKRVISETQIDTNSSPLRRLNEQKIKPNRQNISKSPFMKDSPASSIFESISTSDSELSDAIVKPENAQRISKMKRKEKTSLKLIYRTPTSKSPSFIQKNKEEEEEEEEEEREEREKREKEKERKKRLHMLYHNSSSSSSSSTTSSISSTDTISLDVTPSKAIITSPPNPIRYPFIPIEDEEKEKEEDKYLITVILQPLIDGSVDETDSNNTHSYSIESSVHIPSKFVFPPTLEKLITNLFYTEYYEDYHKKEIVREVQKLKKKTYGKIDLKYSNNDDKNDDKNNSKNNNDNNNKTVLSTPPPPIPSPSNNNDCETNKRKHEENGYCSDDEGSDISPIKRFKPNNYISKSLPSPSPPNRIIEKLNNLKSITFNSVIQPHRDSINILECDDEIGLELLLDNNNDDNNNSFSFYQTNNKVDNENNENDDENDNKRNNKKSKTYYSPRRKRCESKLFDGIYFMFTGFKKHELNNSIIGKIENHSGKIIKYLNEINEENNNIIIVISSGIKQCRTAKYIYSLACGLPPLHYLWIEDSIKEMKLQNYNNYSLAVQYEETKSIFWNVNFNFKDSNDLYFLLLSDYTFSLLGSEKDIDNWKAIVEKLGGKIYPLNKSPRTNHHFILCNNISESDKRKYSMMYPIVFYDWIIECIIHQDIIDYHEYVYEEIDIFKGIKYKSIKDDNINNNNNDNNNMNDDIDDSISSSSDSDFEDIKKEKKKGNNNDKKIISIYYNNYRYKIGDSIQIKFNNDCDYYYVIVKEIRIKKEHMNMDGLVYDKVCDDPPTLKLTTKPISFNEENIVEMIFLMNSDDYEMKNYRKCGDVFLLSD